MIELADKIQDILKRTKALQSKKDMHTLSSKKYSYIQLGLEFALIIFLFVYAGYWLDQKLKTNPLFFLIGFIFGFTLALYKLIHSVKEKDH